MIIGREHRYVFIQLPLSGSSSISAELKAHYGGVDFVHPHATYLDFLRHATEDERTYFVFSCIRNPMDVVASRYQKVCNNKRGHFSRPPFPDFSMWRLRNYLQYQMARRGWGFGAFLKTFYWAPYSDSSCIAHQRLHAVLRFENLVEDFARVLERLGIPCGRPLPHHNETSNKRPFATYYQAPDVKKHARWVFGPFLEEWGYDFPWGPVAITPAERQRYRWTQSAHRAYWRFLTRWRNGQAL